MQQRTGELGFPIVRWFDEDSAFMDTYSVETDLFAIFHRGVREHEAGRAVSQRLQNDRRFAEIEGRLVTTGGGATQLDRNRLAAWYLWRANEVGESQAHEELDAYLSAERVDCLASMWVYGVEPSQRIRLAAGFELVPINEMPESSDRSRFLSAARSQIGYRLPAPSAAIAKPFSPRKIMANAFCPDDVWLDVSRQLNRIVPILNCVPHVCCLPGYTTTYCMPGVPPGPFGGRGGGTTILDTLPCVVTRMDPGHEELTVALFDGISRRSQQDADRLARSLYRLAQAKGRVNPHDASLDLGIALEMVLLGGLHKGKELPGQLHVHFRLRSSWLIGRNPEERRKMFRAFGTIYTLRSQVAHDGSSSDLDKMEHSARAQMLDEHFSISERVLQNIIIDGPPKDWTALLLGAAAES